ncbi:hypothetical protein D3C72_2428280 [compost metagenome]
MPIVVIEFVGVDAFIGVATRAYCIVFISGATVIAIPSIVPITPFASTITVLVALNV